MSASPWQVMHSLTRDGSVADTKLPAGTAKRVLAYARPMRAVIAAFLVLVVADALFVVAAPLLLARLVDHGVIPGDRSVVTTLALLVAAIAVLDAVVTVVSRWYSARIGEGLIFALRSEVFSHVVRQPIAFYTRAQTGALVSRVNNDVIGAQQAFTSVLSSVVGNLVSLTLILAAMIVLSWKLTLAALLLVPFFLLPAKWMGRRLAALSHEQMNLNAEMGTRMTERFNVGGALLVKLFGDLDREDREYAERAARVRDIGIKIAMNRTVLFVALSFIASLATAMVYGVGGLMAIDKTLTVGTLIALAALLARLYGPLTTLSNVRVDIMTALVSFSRVFEILDLRPSIQEAPDARPLPGGAVAVDVEKVSFGYPGADEVSLRSLEASAAGDRARGATVLRDITFRAEPGELIALVGPSGAGKSTVFRLLLRFYDPQAGRLLLDGVEARDADPRAWRTRFSYVSQDAHLFSGTAGENIALGRPEASAAALEDAARRAEAWPFLEPRGGLGALVGDRGKALSGGERQRLALARALARDAPVLLLDEATSALDAQNERYVQAALAEARKGRTTLVIAHRLATVLEADRIVVMEAGRVVEEGDHAALVARGGLYARLAAMQFMEASPLAAG